MCKKKQHWDPTGVCKVSDVVGMALDSLTAVSERGPQDSHSHRLTPMGCATAHAIWFYMALCFHCGLTVLLLSLSLPELHHSLVLEQHDACRGGHIKWGWGKMKKD